MCGYLGYLKDYFFSTIKLKSDVDVTDTTNDPSLPSPKVVGTTMYSSSAPKYPEQEMHGEEVEEGEDEGEGNCNDERIRTVRQCSRRGEKR